MPLQEQVSSEIEQHALGLLRKKLNPPGIMSFPLGETDLVFDGDDAVQVPSNSAQPSASLPGKSGQGDNKAGAGRALGSEKALAKVASYEPSDWRGAKGKVEEPSIGISFARHQHGGPFIVSEIARWALQNSHVRGEMLGAGLQHMAHGGTCVDRRRT